MWKYEVLLHFLLHTIFYSFCHFRCCELSREFENILPAAVADDGTKFTLIYTTRPDSSNTLALYKSCTSYFLNYRYILSRTVPKLLQIIGQICTFDRGCLSLAHSLGWTIKLTSTKFGLKKLETLLYRTVRYLEPHRCGSQVWLTDRQDRRMDRQNSVLLAITTR